MSLGRRTLARDRRGRDERDVLAEVLVAVVELRVEALLGQREEDGRRSVLKLLLHRLGLGRECLDERAVLDRRPSVETVNLCTGACGE